MAIYHGSLQGLLIHLNSPRILEGNFVLAESWLTTSRLRVAVSVVILHEYTCIYMSNITNLCAISCTVYLIVFWNIHDTGSKLCGITVTCFHTPVHVTLGTGTYNYAWILISTTYKCIIVHTHHIRLSRSSSLTTSMPLPFVALARLFATFFVPAKYTSNVHWHSSMGNSSPCQVSKEFSIFKSSTMYRLICCWKSCATSTTFKPVVYPRTKHSTQYIYITQHIPRDNTCGRTTFVHSYSRVWAVLCSAREIVDTPTTLWVLQQVVLHDVINTDSKTLYDTFQKDRVQ